MVRFQSTLVFVRKPFTSFIIGLININCDSYIVNLLKNMASTSRKCPNKVIVIQMWMIQIVRLMNTESSWKHVYIYLKPTSFLTQTSSCG